MAGGDYPVPDWPGRIAGDAGHDRIAACLTLDVQRAPDWAKNVLTQINHVLDGTQSHWDMGMNAYMLKVKVQQTEILPIYEESGEATITVKTADLRDALSAWCEQIAPPLD